MTALGDRDIALLLARLGIRTLGGFTQLSPELVHDRLGDHGLRLRALASGADSRHVSPMPPPTEIVREIAFEPPLDMAEQVAFAVRQTAEAFCNAAAAEGLIVTAVRITIESDLGGRSERIWQHPEHFDAASVVDRVRWQLEAEARHKAPVQAQLSPSESALPGGASRVLIEPEAVDAATAHQPTLIGQGPDERSHHAMTRLQSTLGHEGVLTPTLAGGRFLAEREVLVPWGDAQTSDRDPALPWPGSLPDPLPTEIFRLPRSVRVSGAAGAEVRVDERGLLTAPPAEIAGKAVTGWAGPWPVVEHTWDVDRARHAHRFQVIDASGDAWLVVLENGEWWLEGKYS
ncbi:hypothetical protein ACFOEP_05910 [Microbacterium amylolyticum]|uniref:hypothetical protein n=1 Tax=Microbacterium amylolyticum TaxID=936337 RepID=UPI00360742AF